MRGLLLLLAAVACAADQPFEDSPALTALWQATSDGSTDAYIQQLIQNREYGSHRAADGRGPMFWAYEFKNLDARALLMHLEVSPEQEDVDGKKPKEFFSGTKEELAGTRDPPPSSRCTRFHFTAWRALSLTPSARSRSRHTHLYLLYSLLSCRV